MNEYLEGSDEKKLVSLEAPSCIHGFLRTEAILEVAGFINDRNFSALWIDAPAGRGKTTAVIDALSSSKRFGAIKRIVCYRGMRIEEALYWLNDFLLQHGIEDIDKVLGQRSRLDAKLSVLLNVLAAQSVAVCFDDFHYLEAGCGEDSQRSLEAFVSACSRLADDAAGSIIFTSTKKPPTGASINRLELAELTAAEAKEYWETITPRCGDSPASRSPLVLQLLSKLGPSEREGRAPSPELDTGEELETVYTKVLEILHPATRELLETLAEFGRPLTRGFMKSLSESLEDEVGIGSENTDERLLELEECGLFQMSGGDASAGWSCQLHPFVNDAACQGFHSPAPERIRALRTAAANYYLRLPGSGKNTWSMLNARDFLMRSGDYEEASQLQKCFIEDLLRLGYHGLAKKVLLETIETTAGNIRTVSLGNLAIIHKNENQYEKALDIYRQVRRELEESGDRANLARVLHQIGNIHYLRKELDTAAEHYEESGKLAHELGEESIWLATRIQLANVLYQTGREEDALESYREIVARLQESPADKGASLLASMKVQIGQIHQKAKRFLEAEAEFSGAEELVRASDDKRSLLKVLRARAMVARERRAYEEGLSLYDEAEKTAAVLGDVLELSTCHLLMGDLERERIQLGAALRRYTSARAFLEENTPPGQLQNASLSRPVVSVIESRLEELEKLMGPASYQRALAAQEKD